MLPRAHRFPLRKHPNFFRSARRQFSDQVTLYIQQQSGLSQATVIVPKKIVKTAVRRNWLKIKLQVILSPLVVGKTGMAVVVVVRKNLFDKDFVELEKKLGQVFDLLERK